MIETTMSKNKKQNDKQVLTWTGSVNSNAGAATAANLAKLFTPKRPMYEPGVELRQLEVWMDIPVELATALKDGLQKIGSDCLTRNAEIVLSLFQKMIIKHVIGLQIKDRTFGRIIRGNPAAEEKSGDPASQNELAGLVAKSSMLGQDPFGDKALPTNPAREEGASASGTETAPAYTEVQVLLKNVQDTIWLYLTTHIKRILSEEILTSIIDLEMQYQDDVDEVRTKTARKRMPWKVYLEIVLSMTMGSAGLYELQVLLALCREVGEAASRWLQRLRIGKALVEKAEIKLPEPLYVSLAVRYLTHAEIKTMATCLTRESDQVTLTMSQARRQIRKLSWDKLRVLVETSIHVGGKRYTSSMHRHLGDIRLFTLEQAKEFLKAHKTPSPAAPDSRKGRNQARKNPLRCQKCQRAGLTGKVTHHATEDCVERLRKLNVEKLTKVKPRKRGREKSVNPASSKSTAKQARRTAPRKTSNPEEECPDCKSAGRPYRHAPGDCKYAPGGPWHKKSREELRALQRKYYEGKGRSKPDRSQANAALQGRRSRKQTRGKESQAKTSSDPKRPLWEKEYTMIAEQQIDTTAGDPGQQKVSNEHGSTQVENTPGVPRCNIATLVTEKEPVTAKAELRVLRPGVVDFSSLTARNGPVPVGNCNGNWDEGTASIVHTKDALRGSIEDDEESTKVPSKANRNPKDAEATPDKFCEETNLGSGEEGEYECSESENESVGDDPLPNPLSDEATSKPFKDQGPKKAPTGEADDPIDLTSEDDESYLIACPSQCCHMIRGDPDVSEGESTPTEDPSEAQIHITVTPCGPDGQPYGEQSTRYFWYMDQPMWLLMDTLREDYPVWGRRYKLILADDREVKITQDPIALGYQKGQHAHARLLLLHLPNASEGFRLIKDGKDAVETEAEEVRRAAVAAAFSHVEETNNAKPEASAATSPAEPDADEVVVLEIWSGECLRMSVRWGRFDPFRRMLGALAAIWDRPKHHLILLSTAHMLGGTGCVRSCDTPNTLSMPRGGTLLMHYMPNKLDTSPAFIPPPTVAWQLLKTRGVHVWDKTPSGRKYEMGGFRGSSMHDAHFKYFTPMYGKFKQKVTPYNETYVKVRKVIQKQYTGIARRKRKSLIPMRLEGTDTEYPRVSTRSRSSTKGRKINFERIKTSDTFSTRKGSVKSDQHTGLCKRTRNRMIIGESCTDSEFSEHVVHKLNLTFEPGRSNREISPSQLELNEEYVQNVSKRMKFPSTRPKHTKSRKNRENPKSSTRSSNNFKDETRCLEVSLPRKSDPSTSPTMESDNMTSISGNSDETDTSETLVYKLPRKTAKHITAYRRRKYQPGKTVYTPDMHFPFTQNSSEGKFVERNHKRAEMRDTTCKGSHQDFSITHISDTPEGDLKNKTGEISPPNSSAENSKIRKDKNISFVNKHLPRKRKREKGKPCFSETIPYQLMRTYIKVLDKNGIIRRV